MCTSLLLSPALIICTSLLLCRAVVICTSAALLVMPCIDLAEPWYIAGSIPVQWRGAAWLNLNLWLPSSSRLSLCLRAERTIALLAFEDTKAAPMADLLEIAQRQKTASELNAAILASQNLVRAPS